MKIIDELSGILAQYEGYSWYSKLQLSEEKSDLRELREELEAYVPKVAVIGEFSTGKSTLINSFLAANLLPCSYIPTTKFITEIKYGNNNYILADGERKEATKENLEVIDTIHSKKIEIFLNKQFLKKYSFIDTPGTNDPSSFSDDIVFSLVGEADIVLFVMNANQALKNTEKQFISKLIREKDIGKFFFVINWADILEEPRIFKKEVVDNLASLLKLDKNELMSHTFLYRAKEALSHRLEGKEDGRYDLLSESMEAYVTEKKAGLLEQRVEYEVGLVIGAIELKIEALEDKIAGNSEKYSEELVRIENSIKTFAVDISKETMLFKKDFNQIKSNYKQSTKETVKYILSEIKNDLDSADHKDLVGSRYIELRTKKLLEDEVERNTKNFIKEMGKLISVFDEKIMASTNINSINLPMMTKAGGSKRVVNTAAIVATAAGAASIAPMAGSVVAGGITAAALAPVVPMLAAIPFVGPMLAGVAGIGVIAAPIIGVFALSAGKILFDVGKWGVGMIGDGITIVEEKAKKMAYYNQVKNSLEKIESQIIADIDKVHFESLEEQYINSKFPQKGVLERKIELLKGKQLDALTQTQEEVSELEKFKNNLRIL